jgi:hypothetical protein
VYIQGSADFILHLMVMNKMKLAVIPFMGLSMFTSSAAMAHAAAPSPDQVADRQQHFFQREADLLGITIDEVKSAWAEGKRLMEIAKDHGISKDVLKERRMAQAKAHTEEHLQILVDEGVITQEQADARKQMMMERMEKGKGMRHPMRRFFQGRR